MKQEQLELNVTFDDQERRRRAEMENQVYCLVDGLNDVGKYSLLAVRYSSVNAALEFAMEKDDKGLYQHEFIGHTPQNVFEKDQELINSSGGI
jgi:hypothetical protein